MSSFSGKVVAITGGASGLGLATAKLLASRGAKVSLADVQQAALDSAVAAIKRRGGEAIGFKVDVRDSAAVDAWIQATVTQYGKLTGAANAAGVVGRDVGKTTVASLENDDWDFVIGVNLTGLMYSMRAQLQNLVDGGSIVNFSSIAGLVGRPTNAAYTASKHAVIGLSKSAAKEEGGRGVRVNAIAPGTFDTPILAEARAKAAQSGMGGVTTSTDHCVLNRLGDPEELAHLVAFLLSDESRFITGAVYSIDGGWK